MTDIKAKVVEFDLEKHPNADSLSIAKIRGMGWQCVVRTEHFLNTKLGVYFPLDSELDVNRPEFAFLDKGNGEPAHIKTLRLRQVLSQGLLLPAPDFAKLGDDLTEYYKVKRYEPPVPANLAEDTIRCPANFKKYDSATNYKNYPNVLKEGELVFLTEKLHGSSLKVGLIHDGKYDNDEPVLEFYVGSNSTAKKPNGENDYSKIVRKLNLKEKLEKLVSKYNPKINFIVYGELVGVQNLKYGLKKGERKLAVFDLMIDDKYQSWDMVEEVAKELGLETVPLLYKGPFSLEKALELKDGPTIYGKGVHIREGIVITPEIERFDPEIGRVSIKFISDEYLVKQGKDPKATDGH